MSLHNLGTANIGLILVVLFGAGVVSLSGVGTPVSVVPVVVANQDIGRETGIQATEGHVLNPHSDLIFRATGATSCQDCHRIGKNGSLNSQTIDNGLVRNLREKAKGIHGPGRFADCLRCHAGGSKGVEKY